MIIVFVLWFLAAEAVLTAVQLPFYRKKPKKAAHILLIAGKALLGILFAVIALAGPVQLRIVQPLMMALYVALLTDAAADALYGIYCAVRKKERSFGIAKAVSLLCGVAFLVFGIVNMQTVKPNYHVYTSDKLQTAHTFVFLADLHVGSAQSAAVNEKTVKDIGALHPDFIVLGGDIVDDYTAKEEMETVFRLFGELETPVYYIFGNHDRQGHAQYAGGRKFTPEELEQTLAECGITVLKDEFVQIAPDLVLLGREDLSEESRADAAALTNPVPEAYLIVADHQPGEFRENLAVGTDLQVSGHTHAGQLFPLQAMYRLIGYCSGDYTEGGATLNVSSGACGWRMPIRTDSRCNYEVITLEPEV